MRLAHRWVAGGRVPPELREAVRAVPKAIAERLGACRIRVEPNLPHPSEWTLDAGGLSVALAPQDPHDLGLELLLCAAQALWETAGDAERAAWLELLRREILSGVPGDIDEEALREKRLLLGSRISARSERRLLRYAAAAYAGTVCEYIHALWHDVTVRAGPEHLPAEWLRRRLEALARWFPPNPGYRLWQGGPINRDVMPRP